MSGQHQLCVSLSLQGSVLFCADAVFFAQERDGCLCLSLSSIFASSFPHAFRCITPFVCSFFLLFFSRGSQCRGVNETLTQNKSSSQPLCGAVRAAPHSYRWFFSHMCVGGCDKGGNMFALLCGLNIRQCTEGVCVQDISNSRMSRWCFKPYDGDSLQVLVKRINQVSAFLTLTVS